MNRSLIVYFDRNSPVAVAQAVFNFLASIRNTSTGYTSAAHPAFLRDCARLGRMILTSNRGILNTTFKSKDNPTFIDLCSQGLADIEVTVASYGCEMRESQRIDDTEKAKLLAELLGVVIPKKYKRYAFSCGDLQVKHELLNVLEAIQPSLNSKNARTTLFTSVVKGRATVFCSSALSSCSYEHIDLRPFVSSESTKTSTCCSCGKTVVG